MGYCFVVEASSKAIATDPKHINDTSRFGICSSFVNLGISRSSFQRNLHS